MRLPLLLAAAVLVQEQEPVARFGTTVVIPDGLRGQIYHLKPNTDHLPNLHKAKPVGAIYTTTLNVPMQVFDRGFPGVTDRVEWFAIAYTGRFWVTQDGTYRFGLLSDDGSRLWIDGKRLIDNDGIHPPVELFGKVHLAPGLHQMEVAYFQGPRWQLALVLRVAPPGEAWRVFNVDDFKPPPGVEIPPPNVNKEEGALRM